MEKLSKIVVTIVAVVVFFVISILINAGTEGKAGWVIIALTAGLIAAIKAIWKKDKSKKTKDNEDTDMVSNHKDIEVND